MNFNCNNNRKEGGMAAVPIVLALGIIIVALAVGVTAMTVSDSIVAQGSLQSSRARQYADAGAHDALIRISRNKFYECAVPALPAGCYTLDLVENGCATNGGCARVTVTGTTSAKVIQVAGRVGGNIRKIEVNATLDGLGNGEILSTEWVELVN